VNKLELKEKKILFFTRTMKLGGTENVVLLLCEIFKPLVNKIVVCSCGGVNVEKLETMGIKHYVIPDIENKSLKTIFKTMRVLKSIVEIERISIIHTHHRMAAFYVMLTRLYRKCVFINTCHNTFKNKRLLTRMAYMKANLITCGEMVKKNLVEYFGIDAESITVIHNAVKSFNNVTQVDHVIEKYRNEGKFLIGNVGRLSEQKGIEYYIKAIPRVLEKHPEAHFLIIGEGPDETELKNLARAIGVESNILFMGYRSDIQNIMSQVDIVVLSSLWEGLPLTPIEAFSVGKTIIATAVDGTVEIIENFKSGYLIEPRNSEQLSEKIISLIEYPEKRREMEKNALKRYEEKFSFTCFADEYIKYYKGVE